MQEFIEGIPFILVMRDEKEGEDETDLNLVVLKIQTTTRILKNKNRSRD
jgi:hypothetical protein